MRHAILPRMSSYRVMHTDYIHTHVHTLNTIYVHMCTIPCNPHTTEFYHFMQTNGLCAACSVLPCICHSICTVSHACIVCICHNNNIYGRKTIRSTHLVPVTPYASDLRWKTRHNQDIVIELSVESYLVPIEVGNRQNIERTLGDIITFGISMSSGCLCPRRST